MTIARVSYVVPQPRAMAFRHLPTFTDVLLSSSDVLLALSCLLLMLGRLWLVDGLYIMLCGLDFLPVSEDGCTIMLCGRFLVTPSGDPGGEAIMVKLARRLHSS